MLITKPIEPRHSYQGMKQNKTERIVEITCVLAFIIFLGWFIFFIGIIGLKRSDKAECYKWQSWAKTYPEFYISIFENEQCKQLGIYTGAKVK